MHACNTTLCNLRYNQSLRLDCTPEDFYHMTAKMYHFECLLLTKSIFCETDLLLLHSHWRRAIPLARMSRVDSRCLKKYGEMMHFSIAS
jgi:hypothetical protein